MDQKRCRAGWQPAADCQSAWAAVDRIDRGVDTPPQDAILPYISRGTIMRSFWIAILAGCPLLSAQPKARPATADWPTYNRDLASTRYSPLAQINASNAARLSLHGSYKIRPDPDSLPAGTMSHVTPLLGQGIMYLPARNKRVALHPNTGT